MFSIRLFAMANLPGKLALLKAGLWVLMFYLPPTRYTLVHYHDYGILSASTAINLYGQV